MNCDTSQYIYIGRYDWYNLYNMNYIYISKWVKTVKKCKRLQQKPFDRKKFFLTNL